MVKEELNSEEKLFESAVKAERFVKRYKTPLIAGVAAIAVFLGGYAAYSVSVENRIASSNAAFAALQNDPADAAALETLKELNPQLHDVWRLTQAMQNSDTAELEALAASGVDVVADLAAYRSAVLKNDAAAIGSYAANNDAIYKDLALIEAAVLLMRSGKSDAARVKLNNVAVDSPVYKVARLLMHYGVK